MSTPIEELLRRELRAMADEVPPVDFLHRLDHAPSRRPQRRTVALVVAAVVALVVAIGSAAWWRAERPKGLEPVDAPPKVFRLAGVTETAPGRVRVAVFTPHSPAGAAAALLSTGSQSAPSLATSKWVPSLYSQQLSLDGTHLVRQLNDGSDPRIEVVDLRTGTTTPLTDHRGFCPRLAPDNRTVAFGDRFTSRLLVVDIGSGRQLTAEPPAFDQWPDLREFSCAGMGFSPDGRRLTYGGPSGTLLLDRRGRIVGRIPGLVTANGPMSWSPDGRSLQMYDRDAGAYVVFDLDSRTGTVLAKPPDAVQPMGWAGSRVVWLVGQPGDQRLVTTDQQGRDSRPWMRLDIGDRPVESVMWSRDLSGAPSGG